MASLEVEYELRHVSDVQIASQVYCDPWPYGAIVEKLSKAPDQSAEQLAKAIVASVHAELVAKRRHDAISALRSGRALDELGVAFGAYAQRCLHLIELDWKSVRTAVMEDAQRVDDSFQVDLLSLVDELGKHDDRARAAADAVRARFQTMRVAHAASDAHPNVQGLSIFCPKVTNVDLRGAYRRTAFRDNTWAAFLNAFQIKLARAA
jgi:hypothetical protein